MNGCYNDFPVHINANPVETKVVVRETDRASALTVVGRASFYLAMLGFCLGFWALVVAGIASLVH